MFNSAEERSRCVQMILDGKKPNEIISAIGTHVTAADCYNTKSNLRAAGKLAPVSEKKTDKKPAKKVTRSTKGTPDSEPNIMAAMNGLTEYRANLEERIKKVDVMIEDLKSLEDKI